MDIIIKEVMENKNLKISILNYYVSEDKTFYGVSDEDDYYILYSIGNDLYNEFGSLIYKG